MSASESGRFQRPRWFILHDRDVGALTDMLAYANEAVRMVEAKERREVERDRVLNLALQRLIKVIGEAAGRVSDECREACPDLPWRQMIGMRNRLIHGYDSVDPDILWDTVTGDLPNLAQQLRAVLRQHAPQQLKDYPDA